MKSILDLENLCINGHKEIINAEINSENVSARWKTAAIGGETQAATQGKVKI